MISLGITYLYRFSLVKNFGYGAGADGASAFANREPQTLIHGDRRNQFDQQVDVIARHHHLGAFRQLRDTRHVRRAEVELRTIAFEERRVTSALIFRQDVNFALELGMRLDWTPACRVHPSLPHARR